MSNYGEALKLLSGIPKGAAQAQGAEVQAAAAQAFAMLAVADAIRALVERVPPPPPDRTPGVPGWGTTPR